MRFINPGHTVIRDDAGRDIPADVMNGDYRAIIESGVTIEAYQAPIDVNSERDRRMGAFVFSGKSFSLTGESLANVMGVGTLSLAAIVEGAQPGNLRWADPDEDFTWIADDNTIVPMDAQTAWAFAQTAAAWRKHMYYRARALKDMSPVPADYASNETYWA